MKPGRRVRYQISDPYQGGLPRVDHCVESQVRLRVVGSVSAGLIPVDPQWVRRRMARLFQGSGS